MVYIETNSNDPAYNLALEQYAFDTISRTSELFMLWQNRDAVIVGLHQNTMQEINRGFLESNGIPVVRRLSGGGAVFHDLGNLNFTFITREADTSAIDFALSCRPIADALASMGVPVEFRGRNDMTAGEKKFSGNARYYRDGRLMHHGTLLFDVSLDRLAEALRVPDDKLVSKGVKSVRSRVVNLREYLDMPVSEFWAKLRQALAGNMPEYTLSEHDIRAVEAIKRERYDTWEWNYGQSPEYSIEKRRRLEGFGTIRLSMGVEKGRITAYASDGDYFGVRPYGDVAEALRGARLEREALQQALSRISLNDYYEGLSQDGFIKLLLE
jgi:lipoate-protein ligase A